MVNLTKPNILMLNLQVVCAKIMNKSQLGYKNDEDEGLGKV